MSSGVPLLAAIYGYQVAPYQLTIERITVRSRRIPRELNGFTIGQLSDVHRSRYISQRYIEQAVQALQALAPDMIALTGDYVYGSGMHDSAVNGLRALHAPYGIFAILGNHDYATDGTRNGRLRIENAFQSVFNSRPFHLLKNAHHTLDIHGVPMHIVGINDLWQEESNLEQVVMGVPRDRPSLLLVHEPDFADEAASMHPFALQLSGHSHGGQVRLPFVGAPVLPTMARKYDIGINTVQDMVVYTSRGIGVVSPPIRINCPPEVTLLTLQHT